ncbi:MAG: HDOD domain-containing protein, partial [bacterium]|nr:HDOD domain-containing protein [bacterium]
MPSPPGVALRVLSMAQDEDASLGEIAEVISSDPALAAKILKFVNSPLAGTGGNVASLNQAISLMGLRAVKLMALSFSLISTRQKGACAGFSFDGFWSLSLASAVAGRTVAQHSKTCVAEEAFITGLLSRIGQLGLVSTIPEQYAPVLTAAQESSDPLWEIERRLTETTHMEIGQRLLEHWRLPDLICRSVAGFRDVDPTGKGPPVEPLMQVLYLADQAAMVMCGQGDERKRAAAVVVQAAEKLFGWQGQRWD